TDARQRKRGGGEDQVVLIAALSRPQALLEVDGDHRRGHYRDQRRGRERRQQAQRKQDPAGELEQSGREGMDATRAQADRSQESSGAGEAVTAPDPEQLLGAVTEEQETDHQAQYEQTDIHGLASLSRTVAHTNFRPR